MVYYKYCNVVDDIKSYRFYIFLNFKYWICSKTFKFKMEYLIFISSEVSKVGNHEYKSDVFLNITYHSMHVIVVRRVLKMAGGVVIVVGAASVSV